MEDRGTSAARVRSWTRRQKATALISAGMMTGGGFIAVELAGAGASLADVSSSCAVGSGTGLLNSVSGSVSCVVDNAASSANATSGAVEGLYANAAAAAAQAAGQAIATSGTGAGANEANTALATASGGSATSSAGNTDTSAPGMGNLSAYCSSANLCGNYGNYASAETVTGGIAKATAGNADDTFYNAATAVATGGSTATAAAGNALGAGYSYATALASAGTDSNGNPVTGTATALAGNTPGAGNNDEGYNTAFAQTSGGVANAIAGNSPAQTSYYDGEFYMSTPSDNYARAMSDVGSTANAIAGNGPCDNHDNSALAGATNGGTANATAGSLVAGNPYNCGDYYEGASAQALASGGTATANAAYGASALAGSVLGTATANASYYGNALAGTLGDGSVANATAIGFGYSYCEGYCLGFGGYNDSTAVALAADGANANAFAQDGGLAVAVLSGNVSGLAWAGADSYAILASVPYLPGGPTIVTSPTDVSVPPPVYAACGGSQSLAFSSTGAACISYNGVTFSTLLPF